MPEVKAAPFVEWRLAGASKGVALTTTAAFTTFPIGTNYLKLKPRNFSTAVVARYALNPYLVVLKTTDALGTVAAFTDASENMQDGSTATTLSMHSFDTAANGDFVYVGSPLPFRGVRVTIGNTNSVGASTLTVKYWQDAATDAWTTITATDGTASGGDTFGVTGNVTWTVPTDWLKKSLMEISDYLVLQGSTAEIAMARNLASQIFYVPLFWTRWETSAAFDSTVTATEMQAMNRSTTYDELLENEIQEQVVHRGVSGVGCVEALTDAGTANLLVSVASTGGFG